MAQQNEKKSRKSNSFRSWSRRGRDEDKEVKPKKKRKKFNQVICVRACMCLCVCDDNSNYSIKEHSQMKTKEVKKKCSKNKENYQLCFAIEKTTTKKKMGHGIEQSASRMKKKIKLQHEKSLESFKTKETKREKKT